MTDCNAPLISHHQGDCFVVICCYFYISGFINQLTVTASIESTERLAKRLLVVLPDGEEASAGRHFFNFEAFN
ncbi:hypothetical protein DTO96_101233 [Ephemeroptericola cinctiostellae]|uniref:Uncharacterized protein n=1 Tax=Ephemeroptericola cinctiostellae TaxID=2268024 RepID=A0A345DAW4_9BURK|nr:hypothetical protein DTO96_101233 [Ephemeroptericola cinctiostellae]